MAELPAYHGRTHAVGGTDPISFPSGAVYALAHSSGQHSTSLSAGTNVIQMRGLALSPGASDTFQLAGGTGVVTNFKYLILLKEGFYRFAFEVSWSTLDKYTSGSPFIQPVTTANGGSTLNGPLANDVGEITWDDTQDVIYGEQLVSSEYSHTQLVANFWVNYTVAGLGFALGDWGVGCGFNAPGSATKSMEARMMVSRLGDPLVEVA